MGRILEGAIECTGGAVAVIAAALRSARRLLEGSHPQRESSSLVRQAGIDKCQEMRGCDPARHRHRASSL